MTAVDYAGIEVKKAELVRKSLQGSVFVAPVTSAALTAATLFDAASGGLVGIRSLGYKDIGWTDTTGSVFTRKLTVSDIPGWGSNNPIRSDVTADTTTMQVNAIETNLQTIALSTGVAPSSIVAAVNGSLEVQIPTAPKSTLYRVITVGVDEGDFGEIVLARFFPRAGITNYSPESYSNDKDPLVHGVEFTAYPDSTLGFAQAQLYGGEGWLPLLSDMGIARVVTCTVATTTALVATSGIFTASDVGATLSGTGITPGTTLATFTDSTHAVMSAVGTVGGSAVAVTITPN